jgi:hypothetical protein
MMTSTMITITTMVPKPINMGFLSGCAPASRDGATGIWLGAGLVGRPSRAALGDAVRGRVSYFLKASAFFLGTPGFRWRG